ncbi:hypothetical protein EC2729250_3949 [Escherichia coli 2729250]|nr:hypothetical protein EC2860050_4007 [Escherichia coli 2860050]EMW48532.1 hypothetical protein EC2770900_3853 [Escherichia coli 2770900]EMW66246.1 hypothetical protein EC2749250_4076 [Escherichia coli 2749250]EMW71805.1 hypothetical protein EC2747800_4007 [Escherichia coli 2747800]EMZ81360.1 hypothetical protein ECP03052931_4227 [Escherichia coli p0305293.1]ENA49204.1 hypothetical protein EC2729250_3949 [Escherichia coli 2729250]ENB05169.1 hypothetical protein EC2866350_3897 [Escherichia co
MMLSVYHTLFQHYTLMFLQELQFTVSVQPEPSGQNLTN